MWAWRGRGVGAAVGVAWAWRWAGAPLLPGAVPGDLARRGQGVRSPHPSRASGRVSRGDIDLLRHIRYAGELWRYK